MLHKFKAKNSQNEENEKVQHPTIFPHLVEPQGVQNEVIWKDLVEEWVNLCWPVVKIKTRSQGSCNAVLGVFIFTPELLF